MLTWIKLALCSLLIMFFVTFSMGALVRVYRRKFPNCNMVPFIGGYVLAFFGFIPAVIFALKVDLLFELLGVFLAVCALLFLRVKASPRMREIGTCLICLLTVFLFPISEKLLAVFPLGTVYPFLGLALYLMVTLFVTLDRIPNFSIITLLTQGFLIYLIGKENVIFPSSIIYPAFYIFVVMMSVAQAAKAFMGSPILGEFAAPCAGFGIATLWGFVMSRGYPAVPPVLFAYHLFEIILASIMTFILTRHFYPITVLFLQEKALATQYKPQKVYRYMFFILVLLMLIASLLITSDPDYRTISCAVILVLAGTYMGLKDWGVKKPSLRELGSDLKKGLSELKHQLTDLPLKKEAPRANKISTKKAPLKKKNLKARKK